MTTTVRALNATAAAAVGAAGLVYTDKVHMPQLLFVCAAAGWVLGPLSRQNAILVTAGGLIGAKMLDSAKDFDTIPQAGTYKTGPGLDPKQRDLSLKH